MASLLWGLNRDIPVRVPVSGSLRRYPKPQGEPDMAISMGEIWQKAKNTLISRLFPVALSELSVSSRPLR